MKFKSILLLALFCGATLFGCSGEAKDEGAPTGPAKLTPDASKDPSKANPGGGSAAVPQ